MSNLSCITLAALLALTLTTPAQAASFYVDPANGSDSGSGSSASPFKTLQAVVDSKVQTQVYSGGKLTPANAGAPIKAGDTIVLRAGYHGALFINGRHNAQHVAIAAAPGAKARLSRVVLRDSSRWTLRGLDISPAHAPSYDNKTMIELLHYNQKGPLQEITVETCQLRSVPDISGWSTADWNSKAANGIAAGGTKITIRDNQLQNVNFGINLSASHSLVKGNLVKNFSGDGMRGLGDYSVFEGNTIKNCYNVNANHDDGFQSWSRGSDGKVGSGEVKGVVLRGNLFINYEDPKQPLRGPLQGIGMFDGTYVDWVIENNVIITDHWHGISLYGAKNCRIVNNTVIDPNSVSPGPPWIKIVNHKDGTPPSGCLVRNNLATKFKSVSVGVTSDHNITVTSYASHFVDAAGHDVRLKAGSAAVNTGTASLAPKVDFAGVKRPQGAGVDVGAFELASTAPTADSGALPPADSGAPPPADSAALPPDGGAPPPDMALTGLESGGSTPADGSVPLPVEGGVTLPAADAAGPANRAVPAPLLGGCSAAPAASAGRAAPLLLLLLASLALRRRR